MVGCGLAFKYSWTRRLTKFAIPIHAFALLLASNRLSIVLDLIIVAILVVVYCHRALLAALTLAVCLAAITYLVLDPGLNAANRLVRLGGEYAIRGETHDSLSELSGRNEMWAAMWISYLESPVLGHGYFVSAAAGKLDVWEEYANHSAHNMVLQTLVSTGVIGLVLILWWKLYLLKFMFSSGVSSDSRYYAIFIPLATWYFGWSMLNAAFVGPFRPETIAFSVVVGILIHRVMTTRNQSDLESPVS